MRQETVAFIIRNETADIFLSINRPINTSLLFSLNVVFIHSYIYPLTWEKTMFFAITQIRLALWGKYGSQSMGTPFWILSNLILTYHRNDFKHAQAGTLFKNGFWSSINEAIEKKCNEINTEIEEILWDIDWEKKMGSFYGEMESWSDHHLFWVLKGYNLQRKVQGVSLGSNLTRDTVGCGEMLPRSIKGPPGSPVHIEIMTGVFRNSRYYSVLIDHSLSFFSVNSSLLVNFYSSAFLPSICLTDCCIRYQPEYYPTITLKSAVYFMNILTSCKANKNSSFWLIFELPELSAAFILSNRILVIRNWHWKFFELCTGFSKNQSVWSFSSPCSWYLFFVSSSGSGSIHWKERLVAGGDDIWTVARGGWICSNFGVCRCRKGRFERDLGGLNGRLASPNPTGALVCLSFCFENFPCLTFFSFALASCKTKIVVFCFNGAAHDEADVTAHVGRMQEDRGRQFTSDVCASLTFGTRTRLRGESLIGGDDLARITDPSISELRPHFISCEARRVDDRQATPPVRAPICHRSLGGTRISPWKRENEALPDGSPRSTRSSRGPGQQLRVCFTWKRTTTCNIGESCRLRQHKTSGQIDCSEVDVCLGHVRPSLGPMRLYYALLFSQLIHQSSCSSQRVHSYILSTSLLSSCSKLTNSRSRPFTAEKTSSC
ncbi:hypothetical protein VP01_346g6 [Puccinia sorghi]|uniref:Uncharacterized protein n=1 Tax=Puccinia sorghi TaxID=27349 RepID=A0A0L6UWV1_9BASI|nr:hypothetical protein VP01_346g6 [Puccinia sorghi]